MCIRDRCKAMIKAQKKQEAGKSADKIAEFIEKKVEE